MNERTSAAQEAQLIRQGWSLVNAQWHTYAEELEAYARGDLWYRPAPPNKSTHQLAVERSKLPDSSTDGGYDFYVDLMGATFEVEEDDLAYLSIQYPERDVDDFRVGRPFAPRYIGVLTRRVMQEGGKPVTYGEYLPGVVEATPTREEYYAGDWHNEPNRVERYGG